MRRTALVALLALVAGGLAGCHRENAENEPDESALLQLFEKGRGVRLPEDMQQRLGVETVEVTGKLLAWRIQKPARVYRAADASQPAGVVALLSQDEARQLREGQGVLLQLRGDPVTPFLSPAFNAQAGRRTTEAAFVQQATSITGTLARLDRRTRAVLGRVEALIEFADPNRRFPGGSFLTATFEGQRSNSVTVIPSAAVIFGVEGPFVYTANGSYFTRTPVRLGAASEGWAEVVDGLYEGDTVVAPGADAMWMIELCALKGGTPCCPAPMKGKDK